MRHIRILTLAFSATLLLVGCGTRPPSTPVPNSKMANAQEKIRETVDATSEAAKEQWDMYVREMSQRLDELNLKYDELRARAVKAKG